MAYSFRDTAGRNWTLGVTVAIARAVHDETGLSVYTLPQKKFEGLFELVGDPFKLVDVAWVMCRASNPTVTKPEFEAALDGPAIERMADAVLEAVPDFFSDTPGRENLRELLKRAKRAAQRLVARDTAKIQAFDPEKVTLEELEKAIEKHQAKSQPGNTSPGSSSAASGAGPASSASDPTPLASSS